MTNSTDIARAMADTMAHAAIPMYGKKLRLPDRQRHHLPYQGAAAAVLPRLFRGSAADGPAGGELRRAAAGAH